jgi:hypothetical protein
MTDDDLPASLAAPARRALAGVGVTRLSQVPALSQAELAALHGMGPRALERLRQALEQRGLSFRQ